MIYFPDKHGNKFTSEVLKILNSWMKTNQFWKHFIQTKLFGDKLE